jgi:hypothetical protein
MKTLAYLAVCGLILVVAGTAGAVSLTLVDVNSTAAYDTSTGMTSWVVDNVSQLWEQQFYYSIGTGAVANIASLPLINVKTTDANFMPGDDTLAARYLGSELGVRLNFTLQGGTLGHSDLSEQILLTNVSGAPMSLHFFEYVDLDLNGTTGNDTVSIANGRVADQVDPLAIASETVVTGIPSRYQAGYYADVKNAVLAGNLSNNAGAYTGDAAWAFQWDVTLASGGQLQISKDKNLAPVAVPEPLTVTMLGLIAGVGGVAGYIRKRRVA